MEIKPKILVVGSANMVLVLLKIPTNEVAVLDKTAAGDTFIGSLAVALAKGEV